MKNWLSRWMVGLAAAGVVLPLSALSSCARAEPPLGEGGKSIPTAVQPAPGPTASATPVNDATAAQAVDGLSVDALKSEAFHDLRSGQFAESSKLLTRAASLDNDPLLAMMAGWSGQFETQREGFQAERQKQFEKAISGVHKLLEHHLDNYAIDAVYRAYPLAEDKPAFRKEKWVDDIVNHTVELAQGFEEHEQWFKLLRVYEELSALDPASPEWKDKLKLVTRRVRLLALYSPDSLKAIREADSKERAEVDALLLPSTQPATMPIAGASPATGPTTAETEDTFRTDWHEELRGIKMDMLKEALGEARENYYRDVSLHDMEVGGLNGVKAVLTTKGLEETFKGLADAGKKAEFLAKIDELTALAKAANVDNERSVAKAALAALQTTNAATVDLPEEVLVNEFADGAFEQLDPFSNIIWPSAREEFEKTTQGEFSGVGISIKLDEETNLRVISPLEDSPAFKANIQAGDVITRINGKSARGISLTTAVHTITGPSGTMVTLTVLSPNGSSRDVPLKRETIKVASIKGWTHRPGGGWDYMIDPVQKVAYIRLTNFTKTTPEELNKAMSQISDEGAKGVILDLRNDPGGLLSSAVDVCDKFLSNGVIVKTHPDRETRNQPTVAMAHPEPNQCRLPLIVLVNQYSASASEIVSGALKDQHRAMIVGERTYGKGSVQMLFPLADDTAYLKLTTSHYYLPSGRCIHREENSTEWGVEPDVTVEVTPAQMTVVNEARQEMDILRNVTDPHTIPGDINRGASQAPEHGETEVAAGANTPSGTPATGPATVKKDPLGLDSQLSAAMLLMRLQVNGAKF